MTEAGGRMLAGPMYSPVGYRPGRRRTDVEWQRAVAELRQIEWSADGARLAETSRAGASIRAANPWPRPRKTRRRVPLHDGVRSTPAALAEHSGSVLERGAPSTGPPTSPKTTGRPKKGIRSSGDLGHVARKH